MKVKKGEYIIIDKAQTGNANPIDTEVEAEKNWGDKLPGKPDKASVAKKIGDIINKAANKGGPMSPLLKKMLDDLQSPQIDWKKTLERYMSNAREEPTIYKMPARRHIDAGRYLPGLSGKEEGHGAIVIAIDTSCLICQDPNCSHGMSGSVFEPFLQEMKNILANFKGQDIYIVYASDSVDGVDKLKDAKSPLDRNKMRSTGGNRDAFNPPIKWVEDNIFKKGLDLDCLIYFTDGFANKPTKRPHWAKKIIWVLISDEKMGFGRELHIDPSKINKRIF